MRYAPLAAGLARRYANRGERLEDLAAGRLPRHAEGARRLRRHRAAPASAPTPSRRSSASCAATSATSAGRCASRAISRRRCRRSARRSTSSPSDLGREPETAEVAEAGRDGGGGACSMRSRPPRHRAPPRSTRRSPAAEPDAATMGELVGEVDENIDHAEWGVMLEERLEHLDDRDREVLYLRFVEDLTQKRDRRADRRLADAGLADPQRGARRAPHRAPDPSGGARRQFDPRLRG